MASDKKLTVYHAKTLCILKHCSMLDKISADNKLNYFSYIFPFRQIVSKPVFWKNKKNINIFLSAEFAQRVVKVNSLFK